MQIFSDFHGYIALKACFGTLLRSCKLMVTLNAIKNKHAKREPCDSPGISVVILFFKRKVKPFPYSVTVTYSAGSTDLPSLRTSK